MPAATLADLRDIHLPDGAAATPDAWLAGALAVLLVVAAVIWHRRRRQRTALRELRRLAAAHARDGDLVALAQGLSTLLRRQALARYPESGAAGLCGQDWLAFLDAHGGGGRFLDGPGAALATLPYQERPAAAPDAASLLFATRHWLRANPV
jgi:hypothetical protein